MMSKRDSSGEASATLTLMLWSASYWPLGLVAAMMVVRVLSLHTRPALATLSVCCSIASWMLPRSCSRMLLQLTSRSKQPRRHTC